MARQTDSKIPGCEAREASERFEPLWDELFPAEQTRIVQPLVERIDVMADGLDIRLRVDGLSQLFGDLSGAGKDERRAA